MAEVYDELMKDAPYDQWVSWTTYMLNTYRPEAKRLLDLGCGTGEITTRLSNQGWHMTGVDLSEEMLSIASNKDQSIQWLSQDITNLQGLCNFDCIVSYCDVINYITDPISLDSTFNHAFKALETNGLFLFDVHSVEHIVTDLYGQTFAEVYDDLSYVWFCDPGEKEYSIVHDLTFFIRHHNEYRRFDEHHHQQGYELSTLKQAIKKAGFTIQQVCADFSVNPASDGDRLFFVCQKL
ncbi:methyltransferase domain-containing protein [Halobacillus shinanisalinarum]|uniref:Methyltransferase domain-containing protein n=1 Tax=Halobacillus shinanisalinarum TaxID=2932258 RepID=A0ABY4H0U1_9BACI|nr:class I SAM-dependent methyltransferase [Halobacillus shinanisalinarum]UOQ93801.1 methyltransferase domain-containing protein [Halobacillus shinanisalinarum]